jgi:putative tryptophan/tyrosine transport system substrate-binding protein
MRRRDFIKIACAAISVMGQATASTAQDARRTIGWLSTTTAEGHENPLLAFRQGLAEVGRQDFQDVRIEFRWAENDQRRLPELAAELVRKRVSLIVATGGVGSALAARLTTSEIPIVFTSVSDPVRVGLVNTLNKPGTNATGIASLTRDLDSKRLGLLLEVVSLRGEIGVLVNPEHPEHNAQVRDIEAAAVAAGRVIHIEKARSERELEVALEVFARRHVVGLLVAADPLFNSSRDSLVALVHQHQLPAIFHWREIATAGGLMSYGPRRLENYRQAGIYAGRILAGERPRDLPVMQPTKFEMIINLKAAKLLGITVSPSLLARADEVIE